MTDTDPQRPDLTEQLAHAEARAAMFEYVFRVASDAVLIVRDPGVIIHANLQAEVLFGYYGGELIGLAVEALVPPALRGLHVQHRAAYGRDPRTRLMGLPGTRLVGVRKDGTELPIRVSLAPHWTEHGLLTIATVREGHAA